MTKQDFLQLPTNKETVARLYSEFHKSELEMPFYNEVATALRSYLMLSNKVKRITEKVTTESLYNKYLMLKQNGYRKELQLPF